MMTGYGEWISVVMIGVRSENKCCDDRGMVRGNDL